nr:hypothetical protein CFP56_08516 [Quercus suber]
MRTGSIWDSQEKRDRRNALKGEGRRMEGGSEKKGREWGVRLEKKKCTEGFGVGDVALKKCTKGFALQWLSCEEAHE